MPVSCYFYPCVYGVFGVCPSLFKGCKVFVLAEVSIKKQAKLSTTIRDTYLKAQRLSSN